MTGIGARKHLLSREIDLNTHIQDVIGVIDDDGLSQADAFCTYRTYAIGRPMTPPLKSVVCAVFRPNNPGRIVNNAFNRRHFILSKARN